MSLIIRWLINAVAIGITVYIVPGISGGVSSINQPLSIDIKTLLAVSLIFGLINALVRPILKLLSCPLVLLTLGLFIFVINAGMLLLTSAIAQDLGLQFYVEDFGTALIGSIVISLISIVLTAVVGDGDEKRERRRR
ncbi:MULTISPECIES: phage holin family protein [Herpetosiphon]|uniref:phage holin family protein n=1 Tax=Herpetosiphon TaxID=64 RepID=UPI00195665BB|nr:phage holin family protein [Herpetosiphon giganteus]MBM7841656.1 putative membrane protein [Herpetosiphon giganteus]